MQAEEYQKRLKELLLTKEEYEIRMLKYRKKMELQDQDRFESSRKANEEAERLRREAAAIEAAEKEKDRVLLEDQEREAERMRMLAEEEAEVLLDRLQIIEEQESDRQRRHNLAEIDNQTEFQRLWRIKYSELYGDQIFADTFGDATMETSMMADVEGLMGMTEDEIDKQCIEYFTTAPIAFQNGTNPQIDEILIQLIEEMNITIPILHLKGNSYLIGTQKHNLEVRRNCLLIRIDSGFESFQEYIIKNDRYFQRMLIIFMVKSGEDLSYVVECLINGKQIKGNSGPSISQRRRNSVSPSGFDRNMTSFGDYKKNNTPQNQSALIRRQIYQKKYRDISPNAQENKNNTFRSGRFGE